MVSSFSIHLFFFCYYHVVELSKQVLYVFSEYCYDWDDNISCSELFLVSSTVQYAYLYIKTDEAFYDYFSYGPCQTPTLGFCVQRYLQITSFKPEKYWVLHPHIMHRGYELKLEWERNRLFDYDVSLELVMNCSQFFCMPIHASYFFSDCRSL